MLPPPWCHPVGALPLASSSCDISSQLRANVLRHLHPVPIHRHFSLRILGIFRKDPLPDVGLLRNGQHLGALPLPAERIEGCLQLRRTHNDAGPDCRRTAGCTTFMLATCSGPGQSLFGQGRHGELTAKFPLMARLREVRSWPPSFI